MTVTNYNENNQLYSKYSGRGLEILGFPSANFNNQYVGAPNDLAPPWSLLLTGAYLGPAA